MGANQYAYQTSGVLAPVNNQYPTPQLNIGSNVYSNNLLAQLRTVARMIKLSRLPAAGVEASRQVYFVRMPGVDTHAQQNSEKKPPIIDG